MKTQDCDGNEIEIPTLMMKEDRDEDPWQRVGNAEDFELLIKAMGWKDTRDFESDTGMKASELIGKWWLTMGEPGIGNRFYVQDEI